MTTAEHLGAVLRLSYAWKPVSNAITHSGGGEGDLCRYDQQHGSNSSKRCWRPQLERKKDQYDGKLQWPSVQKWPEWHSVVKATDVI